ncbi:MAG: SMC family ATPase [Candidatus Bathyarchaeota archaeon]|nr:SMC family ATPase [Candidatus Bathyarchaeota archaeon]
MKIDVVQLENIRSHTKSTVPFTRGFNCVVGGVGCGKSSLLYAVDFALFGDTIGSKSFEYLLREGAEACRVTLQFTQNGGTYKLTRGLRRRGKSITQEPEQLRLYQDEQLLASMKNEAIAEQLKAITGLDRELYREIVWFRQEHLKELLDATPRDRQRKLDGLFGLSDYEVAWSGIAQYQRDYETEKRVYEKDPDVNGIEKLNAEYNRASEEFTLLEMELEEAAQKLAVAKHLLEDAEGNLRRMEEKKLAIEELKRREARLNADIANVTRNLSSLAERVEGKKTILANLQSRQVSLDSQAKLCLGKLEASGLPTNLPTEQISLYLSGFDEKITSMRAEQEATSRSIQQDQKRLTQLGNGEGECPLCSQPLSGDYRTELLHTIQYENVERQKVINRLRLDVADLQKAKSVANDAYLNLQTCLTNSANLKARITEEEGNLKNLAGELEEQQRQDAVQRRELELLVAEIAKFDLSELEAAKGKKEQALRGVYSVESELRTKENRKSDLSRRLDDTKERIDAAQVKLDRMDKIRRTVELLGAVRDAYRSIQPRLRGEFVKVLRSFVQQILDSLVGGEAPMLNVVIDESYTPYVRSEAGVDREVANLSGGERTLMAFAYRLGLGQLIMQNRTGHGLSMLMLDEPTENLGSEDGSIERLAEAISRFKAIEQIVAVTHSEAFAAKGDHVVVLEKEAGISKLSIER